jgi:hypothetical protein
MQRQLDMLLTDQKSKIRRNKSSETMGRSGGGAGRVGLVGIPAAYDTQDTNTTLVSHEIAKQERLKLMNDPKKELTPEQLAKIAGGKSSSSSSSSHTSSSSSHRGIVTHIYSSSISNKSSSSSSSPR